MSTTEKNNELSLSANYAMKRLTDATADLAAELSRLERALDERSGVVKQLKDCPLYNIVHKTCRTNTYQYRTPDLAKAAAERAFAEAQAIEAENQLICENNKAVLHRISEMIKNAGISSTYSEWSGSGRRAKQVSRKCAWATALAQNVPTTTHWSQTLLSYRAWVEACDRDIRERDEAAKAKSAAAEQERKALARAVLVAKIAEKYGLDISSDQDDVIAELRRRDKYLDLSISMEETRNDWNDGPYAVKVAIRRFSVDNKTDEAIEEEISNLVENWDGDGRVFRDCHWNYNNLYGMADKEIMDDYRRLVNEECNQ